MDVLLYTSRPLVFLVREVQNRTVLRAAALVQRRKSSQAAVTPRMCLHATSKAFSTEFASVRVAAPRWLKMLGLGGPGASGAGQAATL